MSDDDISDSLGMNNINLPAVIPQPEPDPEILGVVVDPDDDYTVVRKNLKDLLHKGSGALDLAIEQAARSGDYHMVDSVAKLLKVMAETNSDLLNARKTHVTTPDPVKDKENNKTPSGSVYNTTMNFVGSTAEFGEYLRRMTSNGQEN